MEEIIMARKNSAHKKPCLAIPLYGERIGILEFRHIPHLGICPVGDCRVSMKGVAFDLRSRAGLAVPIPGSV